MENTKISVLVVDDDRAILESLEKIFARDNFTVYCGLGGKEALDVLRQHSVDVVLADLMMPSMNGIELLKNAKILSPDIEVVVMTAYGTVDTAVAAMKEGAYDFIEKPLKRLPIIKTVRKAAEKRSLIAENRSLKRKLETYERRSIIGQSPVLRHALDMAVTAASSTATVLLLGESGTGKELFARAVHQNSPRASGPFVAVNLAALPETIMEAELFGYERGAFTGAVARREGRFAAAHCGTLFLDEVGELSQAVQVKLLRVLQEGVFEPLGGDSKEVDVRIVAASNRDLAAEVKEGRFREDLYYRLNVISITLPPLRERREDILLLAEHFLLHFAAKNKKEFHGISSAAAEALTNHSWPGNVRELENCIEHAVVLGRGPMLDVQHLPQMSGQEETVPGKMVISIGTPLEEIERRVINETLRYTRGDKRRAAQLLGIATRTIYRKIEEPLPGE